MPATAPAAAGRPGCSAARATTCGCYRCATPRATSRPSARPTSTRSGCAGLGWAAAKDLRAGDRLGEADDTNDAVVVASAREEHPEGVTVYNLEVAGDHTYFVEDGQGGQTAVWVHNTCGVDFIGELSLSKKLSRQKLDRRLGRVAGDGLDAHHIIPLELIQDERTAAIVQKAARGGFDINGVGNGIHLSELLHAGGHYTYIDRIANKVAMVGTDLTDLTDIETAQ